MKKNSFFLKHLSEPVRTKLDFNVKQCIYHNEFNNIYYATIKMKLAEVFCDLKSY